MESSFVSFSGQTYEVILVEDPTFTNAAVKKVHDEALASEPTVLGLDTEWSGSSASDRKVALLQLAGPKTCVLLREQSIDCQAVRRCMLDETLIKSAVGTATDLQLLKKQFNIDCCTSPPTSWRQGA
eukprot:TRINITY_DN28820_c0_g1_i1.p1 TRINITY_DN28820_c0_g1~~TRINITY_DN28820_c0_g1_i1.p1  ORF type:complete len:127 (+),score=23.50 TRINITY_DN28820_c0_g1_i1:49-429(+)